MRRTFESAALSAREHIRALPVEAFVLVLLVLVSVAWRPAYADSVGRDGLELCPDSTHNQTMSVSNTSATEGTSQTIDFEVVLHERDDCQTVTVNWATADDSAVAGEDYTAASGSLTFAPGETTKQISISLLDDTVSEGVERFYLNLTNVVGAEFVKPGFSYVPVLDATATILPDEDTDAPAATVEADRFVVPPVSGWFDVIVKFNEPVKGFELSDLAVTNGSATRIDFLNGSEEHGITEWRVSIVPDSGFDGNVSISVPAGVATDSLGNSNTASAPLVIAAQGAREEVDTHGPKAYLRCDPNWVRIIHESSRDDSPHMVFKVGFDGWWEDHHLQRNDISVTQNGVKTDARWGFLICDPLVPHTCIGSVDIREGKSGTHVAQVLAGAVTGTNYFPRDGGRPPAPHYPSRPSDPLYIAGDNWTVSVVDATATEGTDETIDFQVSLNAKDDCREVTVNYATADGTATAGEDYTAVSGTLTFATGETTKTVSVAILDDAVSDGGETLTLQLSNVSGHLVALGDAEATGTILEMELQTAQQSAAALTARFENVSASHDGSTAFTAELHFSENIPDLSYKTVAGGLLDVTSATVTRAKRLTKGSNQGWLVTLAPSGAGDVSISLPIRACGETTAICTADSRPLEAAVSATVPYAPEPLTARFENAPASHDGSTAITVELHFSENIPDLSYKTVAGGLLDVTGATVTRAKRLTKGSNQGWLVTLAPSGTDNISISLPVRACGETAAICATNDRPLEAAVSATIPYVVPLTLTVADAEVEEAAGATLDFVVSLSRAANSDITVYYDTHDGTATAGADYEAVNSSFVFSPGETQRTVSVVVLDDAHDEGAETVNFRIWGARGLTVQQFADPNAIGTITNNDPMPRAWIARFGRTVGGQVVDALSGRLDGSPSSHVTVGGMSLAPGATDPAGRPPDAMAHRLHEHSARSSAWDERQATRSMSGRDVLLGSSFHLSSGAPDGTGAALTAWGRVATGGFEADVDDVRMDGDVTTGMLGFDAEWDRVLAGVLVSQSDGDGSYVLSEAMGDDRGTVESTLTGVYPYARIAMGGRVSAWGLAGIGHGELTLHQDGQASLETDLSMTMGAVGVNGAVLDPADGSGLGLSVRSDAMWVRTESERTTGLASAEADVSRLRLILEGEREFDLGDGATVTPTGQVGVRVDGGDAETGAGLELGAGMRYTAGAISVEGQVRALVAHEESGYEEWGASGALRVSPDPSGRGLTLSLAPVWGNASNGPERLWTARDASALAVGDDVDDGDRLDAEVGYGLGIGRVPGVVTPYAGVSFADGGGRSWRSGARWAIAPGAALGVEATRAEAGSDDTAEHGVVLRGSIRW